MNRKVSGASTRSGVVLILASMVVGLCLSGCRTRSKAAAKLCIPLKVESPAVEQAQVTRVEVYWDLSQSMRPLLYTRFEGGKIRNREDSALRMAWDDLDRSWVRPEKQGAMVSEVAHFGVGDKVEQLGRVDSPPKLNAGYTNLPVFALHMGELLKENANLAFVLISDMIVDTPKLKPGTPLCGKVLTPQGSGEVPSLFAHCLAEAWAGSAPSGLAVLGVVAQNPVPSIKEGSLLFFTIFSRNAVYARAVGERILSSLPASMAPAALSFVEAKPVAECGTTSHCNYWQREDIIEEHGSPNRPCRFRSLRKRGVHQVRCSLSSVSDQEGGPLIVSRLDGVQKEGEGTIRLVQGMKVDASLELDGWNNETNVEVGYRLKAKWVLAGDLSIRMTNWLGSNDAAATVHRSLFLSLLNSTISSLAPPRCRTGWRLNYRQ